MIINDEELKRLYWHSRRGMLELDLLLVPFASECLPELPAADRDAYRLLLQQEDQDMFLWFTRRQPAPEEFSSIVELVLEHSHQRTAIGL